MMMLSRTLAHIAYQFSILILFSLTHVAFLVPCAAPRQHKDQARRHTILQLAHRPRQQHGQPSQRCDVRRTPCLADQRYSLVRNPTLCFFSRAHPRFRALMSALILRLYPPRVYLSESLCDAVKIS